MCAICGAEPLDCLDLCHDCARCQEDMLPTYLDLCEQGTLDSGDGDNEYWIVNGIRFRVTFYGSDHIITLW